MAQAKNGDTVKVHYTGKLDDGTIFDTSTEREPLQFTIGEKQLIPEFEDAIIGMSPGDSKTVNILAHVAKELSNIANRINKPAIRARREVI